MINTHYFGEQYMLKTGIKNFFTSIINVFIPMGILYLFIIVITYSFIGRIVSLSSVMINDIAYLIDDSVVQSGIVVQQFLQYAIEQIDWEASFSTVIEQVLDTNWIENTIRGFLETLDISVEGFTEEFNVILQDFISSVKSLVVLTSSMFFVGVALSSLATEYFVRRKTAKRNIKHIVLNWVLQPLFIALFTFIVLWITTLIKGYALLVFVLLAIIHEALALTFSWVVYRDHTVNFGKIVNVKNITMCFVTALIIIAINVAVFMLISFVSVLIAILIILPIAIYSLKILETNADSYMLSLVRDDLI